MDYLETAVDALSSGINIAGVAIIFVLYGMVMGGFSGWLASAKGYGGVAWFFLGLVFGIIALLAIGFAPVIKLQAEAADIYKNSEQGSSQATQLEKLQTLLDSGRITQAEFDNAKAQILL
jgi:membrane protease subunit (stomatin/prohibitin family)